MSLVNITKKGSNMKNILNNGIMFSAPGSESGKTLISCAFMRHLKNSGINVTAYKCGPDYIDPMFHKKCIGIPSENLDGFFLEDNSLSELYERTNGLHNSDIPVIEGAMGLYDGLGGISQEASAYSVAKSLKVPIVLVVDARGMGRSVIPLISGFLKYDSEKLIRGVILNKVSESFAKTLSALIEEELSIKVYGYVPKLDNAMINSRHLGLVLPNEIKDIEDRLDCVAEVIKDTLDIDGLLKLGGYQKHANDLKTTNPASAGTIDFTEDSPLIAVAKDEAFCFYYEENLRILERCGARITYFSPIHDKHLPEGIDGIYMGGGYPENYGKELSENVSMRNAIREAVYNIPLIAECGGFMYLFERLIDKDGNIYNMAEAIKGDVSYMGKLCRFGYVDVSALESCEDSFLDKGELIRGHEFHYYDSTNNGASCRMIKPTGNKTWEGIYAEKKLWAGFPHLYFASNVKFVRNFLDTCVKNRKN